MAKTKIMRVLQSAVFRAICAMIVGVLLIQYREETVTWITIAIGILFFLSGVISCAVYYNAKKNASEVQVFDAQGNVIAGQKPDFPIVGLGSLILGIILAMMPGTFVKWLMYILAAILILGAINQFVGLASIKKYSIVPVFFWICPALILLTGIVVIVKPMETASMPLLIIGWCMLLYGVIECVNAIKIHQERKKYAAKIAESEKIADNNTAEEVQDESVK